jgi:hypothetical protein
MTTNFGATLPNVLQDLDKARCEGAANSVYAMEKVEEQLQAYDLQITQRRVVIFASSY